jgi:hypothetical protein
MGEPISGQDDPRPYINAIEAAAGRALNLCHRRHFRSARSLGWNRMPESAFGTELTAVAP